MSKKAYIGIDGVARKIKKEYIGIDNLARKIKKAYIGIGGVARPCFSSGPVDYYGTITPLSYNMVGPAGVSVGEYALFTGAELNFRYGAVDAYNASLTKTCVELFEESTMARNNSAGASVGNYALFAGGQVPGSVTYSNRVLAYGDSLTRYAAISLNNCRSSLAGASVGNYALFAGGRYFNSTTSQFNARTTDEVEVYDRSLTKLDNADNLSIGRYELAGASVGNYVLFVGGKYDGYNIIDVYDMSLVKVNVDNLNSSINSSVGVSMNDYALFVGCVSTPGDVGSYNTAFAFNISLTRTNIGDLSHNYKDMAGGTDGNYALFTGGYVSSPTDYNKKVEVYDASLTKLDNADDMSIGRYGLAGASVGNYVLFAGGPGTKSSYKAVDVYMINK